MATSTDNNVHCVTFTRQTPTLGSPMAEEKKSPWLVSPPQLYSPAIGSPLSSVLTNSFPKSPPQSSSAGFGDLALSFKAVPDDFSLPLWTEIFLFQYITNLNVHAYDIATCIYKTVSSYYEMHLHAHDIAIYETFSSNYVYCVSSL